MRISDWSSDVCSSDLLQGERPFALELKYLCKGLVIDVEGETFTLRQQSAHDIRRHDVCIDVARMDAFAKRTGHGAAVLVLTNDPAYWLPRSRADTVDAAFDIARSEEHTSELQSLMRITYAVFYLKEKT